jgi:hypothetical protein
MPFPSKRHELTSRFNCEPYISWQFDSDCIPMTTHDAPGSEIDREVEMARKREL